MLAFIYQREDSKLRPVLVTCFNKAYVKNAANLINSFRSFYPYSSVFVYLFGEEHRDEAEKVFDELYSMCDKRGCDRQVIVPKLTDWFHEAGYFAFKPWSVNNALPFVNHDEFLLYCDASHEFHDRVPLIEEKIKELGAYFMRFPSSALSNERWTTALCAEKVRKFYSDENATLGKLNDPQFIGGMFALRRTLKNMILVACWAKLCEDFEVVSPLPSIYFPDGANTPCISHRNDQSVLSMILPHYYQDNPFDFSIQSFEEAGDLATLSVFNILPYQLKGSVPRIELRASKNGRFNYLKDSQ